MKITLQNIEYGYLYYKRPIQVIDQKLPYRLIAQINIRVEDEKNTYKIRQELSPLSGFHSHSLDQSVQYYQKRLQGEAFSITPSLFQNDKTLFNLIQLSDTETPQPIIYALELFLYDLIKDNHDGEHLSLSIKDASLLANLNHATETSFDTVKVKIRPSDDHSRKVEIAEYPSKIRLDGNRKFTTKQLNDYLSTIDERKIDFIEDPLQNREDYKNWNTNIPLALDENLLWGLNENINFQYAVIKPSLYSLSGSFQLIQRCKQQGIEVVISSSYEGKKTHQLLRHLALENSPHIRHGLSPEYQLLPSESWKELLHQTESPFWKEFYKRSTQKASLYESYFAHRIVVLKAEKSIEFLEDMIALMMVGKIVLPVDPTYSELSLKKILAEIGDYQFFSPIKESSPCKKDFSLNLKQITMAILTSGSTGKPKAVCYNLEAIIRSALSSAAFYQMGSHSTFCQSLPLHHIGGLMIFFRAILLNASYSVEGIDQLDQRSFDFISLVPTQLQTLLESRTRVDNLKKAKAIILGGASTPQALFDQAKEQYLPLSLSYGMSETTAQITAASPSDLLFHSGKPLFGNQLYFSSDQTLQISSDRLAQGYLVHNEASPLPIDHGRLITSDRAKIIDEKLHILGRKDRIFISGGENVSPEETETLLHNAFSQLSSLLVPITDKKFGQVGVLFYESTSLITPQEIQDYLKKHLPPYKIPKYFQATRFPRSKLKLDIPHYQKVAKELKFNSIQNDYQSCYIDNQKRSTILALHGFMGNHQEWLFLTDYFGPRFNYLFIDLPGHGLNQLAPIDKDHFFSYLTGLIEQHSSVTLIGYSMGGRVLSELLTYSPHLHKHIKCIILESSHPGGLSESEGKQRETKDAQLFTDVTTEDEFQNFLHKWYQQPLFADILNKVGFKKLRANKKVTDLPYFQKCLNQFTVAHQPDTLEALSTLHTYYITGDKDLKYHSLGLKMQSNSGVKLKTIRECGHNTHKENPQKYLQVMSSILLEK